MFFGSLTLWSPPPGSPHAHTHTNYRHRAHNSEWMRVRSETLHKMTCNKTKIDLFSKMSSINNKNENEGAATQQCVQRSVCVCSVGSHWMTEYVKMKGYRYMDSVPLTVAHAAVTANVFCRWYVLNKQPKLISFWLVGWSAWALTSIRHQKHSRRDAVKQ